jgi:dienelactone hydrolase
MGADWQLHAYGNTMHAFTNPAADNPDMGTVYDATADRRSWQATMNFLEEIFSG